MKSQESLWNKLKSQPMAIGGLFFIVLLSLISIFAYFIIEDKSPNSNEQHPEVALKKPGFHTAVILLKRQKEIKENTFSSYFTGMEIPYQYYPVLDATILDDNIQVTTYFNAKKIIKAEDLYKPDVKDNISERSYMLGTDRYGRSIMSRLILGIRISLWVGLFAVFISLTIGITLGAIGGYYGGWIDRLIMYVINVTWSIPTLLLVFAIVLAMGRGLWIIILAIGLTMWVDVARIVRGQVKKLKEEQYVQAAKSMGVKSGKILFKHILPNIIGPILVIGAANFATAILIEAGLSYLGFGVKPPTPSIGSMLNEHYGYAISGKPILALIPAVTIMLLVLAINLLGTGMRDAFDVKSVK